MRAREWTTLQYALCLDDDIVWNKALLGHNKRLAINDDNDLQGVFLKQFYTRICESDIQLLHCIPSHSSLHISVPSSGQYHS